MSSFLISCDDEVSAPSEVTFTGQEFTSVETDGKITLGIQLNKPALEDVIIGISTAGTATAGKDYESPEATIVIPRGETNGSFSLTVLDDFIVEENETVVVSTSSSDGLSPIGTYTITIENNDECNFDFFGKELTGTDVNLDKAGFVGEGSVVINPDGLSYTIDGLNADFMLNYWGEEIQESVPVKFTIDKDGIITIKKQYIFTTLYDGDLYDYSIYGSGKVNSCDGTVTIDYEMDQDGFLLGAYFHAPPQNDMTDAIFKAVVKL